MGAITLGLMYYFGRGVAKDLNQAKFWNDKALKNGYKDAGSTADIIVSDLSDADNQRGLNAFMKKNGFEYLFKDTGVENALSNITLDATPMTKLRKTLIGSNSFDGGMRATQILSSNQAMFVSERGTRRIIIQGYKGDIYQGTRLTSLGVKYWKILGVKNYTTVLGASAQAFILSPAL